MLPIDNDKTQDWFDNKIGEATKIRETFFKIFKKIFRQTTIFVLRENNPEISRSSLHQKVT